MEAQTQEPTPASNVVPHKPRAVGRKGSDKQEAVIDLSKVKDRVEHLIKLYKTNQETGKDLNDGIKAVAEKSGLLSSVVRRYIIARAGDKFEEEQRKVEQLSLLFDDEA